MFLTNYILTLVAFCVLSATPLLGQSDFISSRIHVVDSQPSTKLEVTFNTVYQFRKITRVFTSDTTNQAVISLQATILEAFRQTMDIREVTYVTNGEISKEEIDSIGVYFDYIVSGGIVDKDSYFARVNMADGRFLGVVSLDKKSFDQGILNLQPVVQNKTGPLEKVLANFSAKQFFKLFGKWSTKGEALKSLTESCTYEHAYNLYDGTCLLEIISQVQQKDVDSLLR